MVPIIYEIGTSSKLQNPRLLFPGRKIRVREKDERRTKITTSMPPTLAQCRAVHQNWPYYSVCFNQ